MQRKLVFLGALLLSCAPPPAAPLEVTSGPTTLRPSLAPFGLAIEGAGETLRGERDCAPLAVALRPLTDEGTTFHRPDAPSEELEWLRSGDAVVVSEDPLTLEVALEGASGPSAAPATVILRPGDEGFVDVALELPFRPIEIALATTCFALADPEHVVGGGERFGGVDLRGRTIPLYFTAPGPYASSTNESHAPVPFFTTTGGLGAWFETETVGAFDVGDTQPGALIARFDAARLDLRLRAGALTDNVAAHNRRVGLPPPPPLWALAPQQWRNEHEVTLDDQGAVVSTGQDRALQDAADMRALDIPNTTMWIDAPWSTGYNTFEWNELQFPDAPGMIESLEDQGYRVIVWATEHLNRSNDADQQPGMPEHASLELFHRFDDEGWLVKTGAQGAPFTFPWPRGDGGFVDFTHPAAVEAWQALMTPLLEMGVRGFKLDYGETMRADLLGLVENSAVQFHDGSDASTMHTRYSRLYHEAYLGALQRVHPDDWYVITRTGGIYDQRNGVTLWPGDLENDLSRFGEPRENGELSVGGLPAAISGGLSLAMSGYPLYGSDIGGYRGGAPTTEVLLRWAQAASLMPIMQLGGGGTGDTTHNPWDTSLYDEGAADIYRRYARLHMDLLPTLRFLTDRAAQDGTPPVQPLGALAPDDEAAWADPEAYALGDDLICFPVVEAGATTRAIHLPAGCWVDYWDANAEPRCGPLDLEVDAPLDTMPVFLRAGSVVVTGDPRLMTAVSTGGAVADLDQFGDARVLLAAPGPDGSLDTGELSIAWRTEGDRFIVEVDSAVARPLALDLRAAGQAGVVGLDEPPSARRVFEVELP